MRARQHRRHLVAIEPARIREFLPVDGDRARRIRQAADHQREGSFRNIGASLP
jgi:hypothetical protein